MWYHHQTNRERRSLPQLPGSPLRGAARGSAAVRPAAARGGLERGARRERLGGHQVHAVRLHLGRAGGGTEHNIINSHMKDLL